MKLIQSIFIILVCVLSFSVQAENWPPLPKSGFIVGRSATQDDAKRGIAVFSTEKNGVPISIPIKIKIPQYAYYHDKGKKLPVVIIQAEEANGLKVIGAMEANGGYTAGLMSDFELLGDTHPK